jgi:hypothetical protein
MEWLLAVLNGYPSRMRSVVMTLLAAAGHARALRLQRVEIYDMNITKFLLNKTEY